MVVSSRSAAATASFTIAKYALTTRGELARIIVASTVQRRHQTALTYHFVEPKEPRTNRFDYSSHLLG